ncbi:MAG TPA: NosD domain-containing protein [Chthoniobacterales bacterium]|nr:NosD domain-containing protein [Chthoniobacterales bacterium]
MKTLLLRTLICLISLASTTALMAQDPRTPISALPYNITMQGSYYLTANLTAVGSGQGITISADNVTLDLDGFALIGGGSGQVAGINVSGMHKNIQIKNGTVRGWTNGGVNASSATNSVIQGLRLSNNSASIAFSSVAALSVGSGSTVKDCFVAQNPNCHGIAAGTACSVTGCNVHGNSAGAGIRAADNCYVVGNISDSNSTGITMGSGNRIENNSCTSNGGSGVFVPSGATNNVLIRNTARSNNPNYNIASGNRYGTIANLTPGSTGAAFGDAAATTIVTSDPWANFAY